MRNHWLLAVLIVACLNSAARAEDWPQWRGPHFNGSSLSANLPDKLDDGTRRWATELPGPGSGTPIVSGGRIFLSAIDRDSSKLLAMCISRVDGKVLWSKPVGLGFLKNERNNTASPSAVTDGKMVWYAFGTGDLVAFDVDGNAKWARNLQNDFGPFNVQWIYGSSPLLYEGKLYVQVLHRDVPVRRGPAANSQRADSYLLAVDPQTGKDLWRHVRPSDAHGESHEAYTTPVPFENGGHAEILVAGGDCITAHDPQNGNELWRCGGWNPRKVEHWRLVASAVAADGLVFACPPKNGPMFAIKDGGSGDVTDSMVAWKSDKLTSDVCVPLVYKEHLYVLDGDRKVLYCVEPRSGHVIWSGSLGGSPVFRASPTGADDKIYCMNEAGDVWVLGISEFKVLSKTSLGGRPSRASITAVEGQIFVRAGEKLYSFGKR